MPAAPNDWLRSAKIVCVAACFAAFALFVVWLQGHWREQSLDVAVYWEAGTRMRQGSADLYADPADVANSVGRYIYPPTFAVLFAPLTWLPRWAGYAVWGLLQLAFVGVMFSAMVALGRRLRPQGDSVDLWVALAGTLFVPVWQNLYEGQINTLVVALVALGLLRIERGKPLSGGFILGFAAHLKILPGVLLLVLAVQRRWRACAGLLLGLVLTYFSPLVWTIPAHGLEGGFERVNALTLEFRALAKPSLEQQSASGFGGTRAPNNSLTAVTHRWLGQDAWLSHELEARGPLAFALEPELLKPLGFAIGCVLYALAVLLAWRRRGEPAAFVACSALAFIAAGLGNLLCWPHHLVFLGLLVCALWALGDGRLWVAAGVLWAGCNLAFAQPLLWLQVWGVPTACVLAAWAIGFGALARRPRLGSTLEPARAYTSVD
jgi:hypothetical protein